MSDDDVFSVQQMPNSKDGRGLFALKDIKLGQVIVRDQPIVVGPLLKSKQICVQCQRLVINYKCSKCSLPVCDYTCEIGNNHRIECQYFASISLEHAGRLSISNLIGCVTILRLLIKLKECKDLMYTIGHEETEKQTAMTALLLRMMSFSKADFSLNEIRRAVGIIRINGLKLSDATTGHGPKGVGVYPTYSMLNHSCMPNTRVNKYGQSRQYLIEVIATTDISQGEQIYTRYVPPQMGTYRRQHLLELYWGFNCTCKRCIDPTEAGTMMNAIKCKYCSGYQLPDYPVSLMSPWRCKQCGVVTGPFRIKELLEEIENLLDHETEKSVIELENFLKLLCDKQLHPNHYLCLEVHERIIKHLRMIQDNDDTNKETKRQTMVHHVSKIAEIIKKVDSPSGDQWQHVLDGLKSSDKERPD